MLAILIKTVHFIVCIGLVVVVLLQANKGEGLAGAFGGGASSTIFGDRGDGGIMAKVTTGMAIIFMVTSLIISIWLPTWEKSDSNSPRIIQTSGSTKLPEMPVSPMSAESTTPGPTTTAAPAPVVPAPIAPAPVVPAPVTPEPVPAPTTGS